MARITVEDCLDNVENRFELVLVGAKRARQLSTGGKEPLVEEENDKPTVIALREVEKGLITSEILHQVEEPEEFSMEGFAEGMEQVLADSASGDNQTSII